MIPIINNDLIRRYHKSEFLQHILAIVFTKNIFWKRMELNYLFINILIGACQLFQIRM